MSQIIKIKINHISTSIMSDTIHKTIADTFGLALIVAILFLIVLLLFIIILNLKTATEMAR